MKHDVKSLYTKKCIIVNLTCVCECVIIFVYEFA